EILHAAEARVFHLAQEAFHDAKRIGAAHARQHRRLFDYGEHLAGHVHDDLVGVAVGHHAREAAATGLPEAAGVVDDDQVDAAGLGAFGADAGAGAAADDRLARRHLRLQTPQTFFAREHAHGTNLSWGLRSAPVPFRSKPPSWCQARIAESSPGRNC